MHQLARVTQPVKMSREAACVAIIFAQLKEKAFHIPEPTSLPGCHDIVPYVFVGDNAFPLMENLMKPYAQRNVSKAQHIYNYRVSRAPRVVENTFGIMASRFRILLSTILSSFYFYIPHF